MMAESSQPNAATVRMICTLRNQKKRKKEVSLEIFQILVSIKPTVYEY